MKIKVGDSILVISGNEKGKKGKVLKAFPKKERVIVEGLNSIKRHLKPSQKTPQGGILEYSAPMHVSNVMLICTKCNTPTRVNHSVIEDGSKVRMCSQCGEMI